MLCPCGQTEIDPRDLRDYLRSSQDARMAARMVVRGEAFGGAVIQRRGDGLYVGPDRGAAVDEPGDAERPAAARSGRDAAHRSRGALERLRGLLGR